ncbi:MAG: N-acetylmuramoyl-L-alanine amidase [Legionellaceae bacterium]|nr:N-acetylmuramoyl-L-alanine amidase [Legionellaceae bacterium]
MSVNITLRAVMFAVCILLSVSSVTCASILDRVDVLNQTKSTAILCKITGRANHKAFILHQPERVVIDFAQTTTTFDVRRAMLGHALIKQVRIGHPNAKTLRIVLDVSQPVVLKTSLWQPGEVRHSGVRFDLQPAYGVLPNRPIAKTYSSHIPMSSPQKPVHTHEPTRSLRDVIVVLDPGHGGKDPGALGIRHSTEKHVVLAIAQQLKRLIDRQPGMHAVLTRNGDYYVGLRERMTIARKYNGDIFVAIHADAFGNHDSHGASVFALSQTGATSEAARWLAEKENYSELGGVNLSNLDDRNGEIRTVLIDLSQTATISASLQMGNRVLSGLDRITTLHSSKVEQARFMVLKSPDIPSVLIETGFISNPREEMNLTSPAYQARLTQAIFSGIKNYFWEYPPHGTRIEALSGVTRRLAHVNVRNRPVG